MDGNRPRPCSRPRPCLNNTRRWVTGVLRTWVTPVTRPCRCSPLLLLLLAAGILAAPARAQAPYYPPAGDAWERRTPEQAGLRPASVQAAVELALARESTSPRDLLENHRRTFGREPHGEAVGPFRDRGRATGLIVRGGYIVAEWGDPHRVDVTFSVTKSFLSTVVGLAVDRGLIRDVHDPVAGYVPPVVALRGTPGFMAPLVPVPESTEGPATATATRTLPVTSTRMSPDPTKRMSPDPSTRMSPDTTTRMSPDTTTRMSPDTTTRTSPDTTSHEATGVAFAAFEVLDLFVSEHNRRITWDHLLRQTSDWQGTLWGKPDWADRPRGDVSQWRARPRDEAGTVYAYNDVRVNLLALAALNVWRRPLPQVLRELVMDPIGASGTWRWYGYDNSWLVLDGALVQSVSGGAHWGGGMFINARDMARFGLLTARRGRWGDRQILSEQWLHDATTPGVNPQYGYMNFFLNTGRRALPSAPEQAFYHLGAGNNVIYVDPVNDIVVVARWIDNLRSLDGMIERLMAGMTRDR
jgi:CubicO group peptidase (beta-lactamase class C family)